MALLFMDGFGGQDSNFKWDVGSATYTTATATPRTPGNYYWTNGSGATVSMVKNFTASSRIFVGYGWYTSVDNSPVSFYGDGGVTQHITVVRNATTRFLEIRRGSAAGTLLATGTQQVFNNQWNYIEISVTISDTIGEVHVRLNGSSTDEVSYTGDTKNGGTATTLDKIHFTFPNAFANYFADVYILNDTGATNNTFLGDVTVRTLSPNGNGTSSQLVGSDGNSTDNYLLVDEHPYSATDYVGSATIGQKDTYTIANLPAGVSTVYGVQVSGMMAKSDSSLAQARYIVRSGGTDYGGTTRALTTTYTGYYDLHETDPATGVAWTPGGVNNMESGMEVM
jgi:hypothetical protein